MSFLEHQTTEGRHSSASFVGRTRLIAKCLLIVLLFCAVLLMAVSNHPVAHTIESGPVRHALAFAILPLSTALLWPQIRFWSHILFYAVFGGAIELAQWQMQAGRTGEIEDWLVDIAVAVAVLAIVEQVRLHRERRNRGTSLNP